MAAMLGALIGRASESQMKAMGEFAEAAGVAFQIQDDILNITGNLGKEFGEDVKEGKRSLLAIHALNSATKTEQERLIAILDSHTSKVELVKEAIEILKKHNSIEYAEKVAGKLIQEAWAEVDKSLPESNAKKQLQEILGLMLSRTV